MKLRVQSPPFINNKGSIMVIHHFFGIFKNLKEYIYEKNNFLTCDRFLKILPDLVT